MSIVGKNEALFFMMLNFSKQLKREKSRLYAESRPDQDAWAISKVLQNWHMFETYYWQHSDVYIRVLPIISLKHVSVL